MRARARYIERLTPRRVMATSYDGSVYDSANIAALY